MVQSCFPSDHRTMLACLPQPNILRVLYNVALEHLDLAQNASSTPKHPNVAAKRIEEPLGTHKNTKTNRLLALVRCHSLWCHLGWRSRIRCLQNTCWTWQLLSGLMAGPVARQRTGWKWSKFFHLFSLSHQVENYKTFKVFKRKSRTEENRPTPLRAAEISRRPF